MSDLKEDSKTRAYAANQKGGIEFVRKTGGTKIVPAPTKAAKVKENVSKK